MTARKEGIISKIERRNKRKEKKKGTKISENKQKKNSNKLRYETKKKDPIKQEEK